MIPRRHIIAWRTHAPWLDETMVEQDLILSRAIVDVFSDNALSEQLAFRGGTALHKIFLRQMARYSEDIDLVQFKKGRAGPIFDQIQSVLNPWLGKPKRVLKSNRVNLIYRYNSESTGLPAKLKVEINTRENFSVLGRVRVPFEMQSAWFSGKTEVQTFPLDELLATKLRALYQRKKGRDLFDLWMSLQKKTANPDRIVSTFQKYMQHSELSITQAQFEKNMKEKMGDSRFVEDIFSLLPNNFQYSISEAMDMVQKLLIEKLPGEPWKGEDD